MEKKYQIFISSTYEDLIEERKKVQDTILSMYQFPIGMEMFSAADEEQWEIIIHPNLLPLLISLVKAMDTLFAKSSLLVHH